MKNILILRPAHFSIAIILLWWAAFGCSNKSTISNPVLQRLDLSIPNDSFVLNLTTATCTKLIPFGGSEAISVYSREHRSIHIFDINGRFIKSIVLRSPIDDKYGIYDFTPISAQADTLLVYPVYSNSVWRLTPANCTLVADMRDSVLFLDTVAHYVIRPTQYNPVFIDHGKLLVNGKPTNVDFPVYQRQKSEVIYDLKSGRTLTTF